MRYCFCSAARLAHGRLVIPAHATAGPDGPSRPRRALRLTFEIEVRGAETIRELLVLEVGESGDVQVVGPHQWPLEADWAADPSITEVPVGYDRIVALARSRAEELAQPWIEMAVERAEFKVE